MSIIRCITALALTTACVFVACSDKSTNPGNHLPDNSGKVTIKEGLWGDVLFWEGDFMPSTSGHSGGTITPVIRTLEIYEATPPDSVVSSETPGFFKAIRSQRVATLSSDKSGFFQIALPPGTYSLFVVENSLLYVRRMSAQYLCPYTVTANGVTKCAVDITYKAYY